MNFRFPASYVTPEGLNRLRKIAKRNLEKEAAAGTRRRNHLITTKKVSQKCSKGFGQVLPPGVLKLKN